MPCAAGELIPFQLKAIREADERRIGCLVDRVVIPLRRSPSEDDQWLVMLRSSSLPKVLKEVYVEKTLRQGYYDAMTRAFVQEVLTNEDGAYAEFFDKDQPLKFWFADHARIPGLLARVGLDETPSDTHTCDDLMQIAYTVYHVGRFMDLVVAAVRKLEAV